MNEQRNERPWIKMAVTIVDDRDLDRLAPRTERLWWRVLALCGSCGHGDELGMSDPDIAWRLRWKKTALSQALASLIAAGLIERTDQGLRIASWHKHQPGTTSAERMRESRARRRVTSDERVTSPKRHSDVLEAEVEEEVDGEVEEESPLPPAGPGVVRAVFEAWTALFDHPKAKFDRKRRACIERALRDYTVEELGQALDGYTRSPHHMGQTNGTRYDSITLLLRDPEHIERGLAFHRNPPLIPGSRDTALKSNLATGQRWLERNTEEHDDD